jgi:hypothetical protein
MTAQSVLLTSTHTIDAYKDMVKRMAADEIADFVAQRFTERYLEPARPTCSCGSGFTTVATCCLLVEALESFYSGWPDTSGKSQLAFCQFFQRFPRFTPIYGHSPAFYRHIRCGILHQAETTGGWLIRRTGTMFDPAAKTLDPNLFHQALVDCLNDYCSTLRTSDWHHSEVWQNFRDKMKSICDNCDG